MLDHLAPYRAHLPLIAPDRYLAVGAGETSAYPSYDALVGQAGDQPPPEVAVEAGDLYNIIYSSGTTGTPKGIMHTHLTRAIYCLTFATSFRITPESVICHAGSLAFNGCYLTLMPAFFQGATYVLLPHFDVRQLVEVIAAERVTHIVMVPSQIVMLLNSPYFDAGKLRSLEMICSVGAPLHLEHKERLNRLLPGIFYELYGLTEGFSTILDRTMYAAKPGSVGVPPPMHQLKICDAEGNSLPPGQVGEVIGRGPKTMAGYYKRPDLTAQVVRADGWLHTGDLGYMDDDGYLYLVDRQKDMMISGGINVYPRDIEEVIVKHPGVMEAAVFGIPDERWGETPAAAVIPRQGETIDAGALREWINAHVDAAYQKVSAVMLCQDFPRSPSGKTLKRLIREEFLLRQATQG
jgi:acyl-CoA synthetase (AMP-forming)/AMP-acid ligase II